jgi:Ca2+-binding RTX toxin-like protein
MWDTGVRGDSITKNSEITGSGDPGATVHFTVDGAAISTTATADASGTWTYVLRGLADGPHVVVASETDAAGNAGSSALAFTLDTQPPTAAFGSFTETAVKGGYKLVLTGAAADATSSVQSVTIHEDGNAIGSAHPANGTWSFTDSLVSNAAHTFTLTVLDAAGNTGAGAETLVVGTSGSDSLTGAAGDNVIYGGAGTDTLTGGSGANTYVYHAASEAPASGWGSHGAETITNFHEGVDHIDLSALGALAYGGQTQTMSAHHIDWYVSGGNTYVAADVTGDTRADLLIKLTGVHSLSAADFIHG